MQETMKAEKISHFSAFGQNSVLSLKKQPKDGLV